MIYGGSAVAAAGVAAVAGIPIFREWGRLSVGPYVGAAVVALALARTARAGIAARVWLAAVLAAGVIVVPLALEVAWRAETDPGLHVQSEAIVTEEAARALVHGRDPYEVDYLAGPLAARPLPTKTHFPYMPAMLAFGLPRALFGTHAWTDARLWFLAAAAAVAGLALTRRPSAPADRRLRLAQWLFLIPTGALSAVAGGHDLPALALLLLAFVLLDEGHPSMAGLATGLAVALKQTAFLVAPFVLIAAAARSAGRRPIDMARPVAGAALVAAAVVLPFLAWGPASFFEDAIRFPLSPGPGGNPNDAPSLGHALVAAFPHARGTITAALLAAALVVWGWLLVRPAPTIADAARRAGIAFLAVLVLLPAPRVGYLAYPINLLAWAWAFGDDPRSRCRGGTVRSARRERMGWGATVVPPGPTGSAHE